MIGEIFMGKHTKRIRFKRYMSASVPVWKNTPLLDRLPIGKHELSEDEICELIRITQ